MKAIIASWIFTFVIAILLAMFVISASDNVRAAPSGIPACEPINSAGGITIYRCEPDNGYPYLVNSVGFMVFEE